MLEIRAIVINVEGADASVQPLGKGGCGHCDSSGGCGSGALARLFCSSNPRQFTVRNEAHAKVGDEVRVSLPDGALFRGAMKMYVFPLLLLLVGGFFGAGLAADAASHDAYSVAGACIGLLLGFSIARWLSPNAVQAVASSIVTSHSGS